MQWRIVSNYLHHQTTTREMKEELLKSTNLYVIYLPKQSN